MDAALMGRIRWANLERTMQAPPARIDWDRFRMWTAITLSAVVIDSGIVALAVHVIHTLIR